MKNKTVTYGDTTCLLCYRKGEEYKVLVDKEDVNILEKYNKWQVNTSRGNAVYCQKTINKVHYYYYLHRVIMNAAQGMEVDHINGNPLDNRKCNLRVVSHRHNLQNFCKNRSTNTSGYRGVSYMKSYKKWEAYYWTQYKKVKVGYFDTAEEAHAAVVKARSKHMPYSPDARREAA